MQTTRSVPPDLQTLTTTLKSLLVDDESSGAQLTVVDRERTIQGTFPKEIVTCRLDDGREIRLFCKYAAGHNHNDHGHRGGLAREAAVYRELLQPMQISVPTLKGIYVDSASSETWLILEYLEGSVRVQKSLNPNGMHLAARWIGQFHLASETRLRETDIPFLKPYDAAYYLGWAQRTSQYAGHWHERFPWLQTLCESFEEVVTGLLSAPPTVIHGEYYPKNILFRDGIIYPIDWESAAIAAGVIDLASLTDAWPEDIARQCALEYQQARWPAGVPADCERRLCAAQLYLHFRWLGASSESAMDSFRFRRLHSLGRELGLI